MRYGIGFLCVCALRLMPLVGCDLFPDPYMCIDNDCPDDGNECTDEFCHCDGSALCTPTCISSPADNGTDCTFDGVSGVCVEGVCGENLCEGIVCEDDDVCTDDTCDYVGGTCYFPPTVCNDGNGCTEDSKCDPADGCTFTPLEDGTGCTAEEVPDFGVCEAGVCVAACDPASKEELQCPINGLEDDFCCPGWEYCIQQCS